jgi:uncharacterized protein
MILPDVNVLIYAFRPDSERHAICRRWLDRVVLGEAAFGVSPQALGAVARIVTNPRIFVQPSPLDEVFAYCDNLLGQPHGEVVTPGRRHWAIFKRLCVAAGVRGPLVADAWFAALAIERGCVWITFDRDYARFAGLEWRPPDA